MLRHVHEVAGQILDLDKENPIIVAAMLAVPTHVKGHPDDADLYDDEDDE